MDSKSYKEALADCTKHHATSATFSGKFIRPHAPFIKEIVDRLGCRSILDYGCGKGEQYRWRNADATGSIPVGMTLEEYWGVPVTKYDPAWPPYATEPAGTFDMVICSSVLRWIPGPDIPAVVDRLYSLAGKAIYVAEKLGPVKKSGKVRFQMVDYDAEGWARVLRRDSDIEVTLATRYRGDDHSVNVNRMKV